MQSGQTPLSLIRFLLHKPTARNTRSQSVGCDARSLCRVVIVRRGAPYNMLLTKKTLHRQPFIVAEVAVTLL